MKYYFYYLPGVLPTDMPKGIEQTDIIESDDIELLKKNSVVLISNRKDDFSNKKYDVAFVRANSSLKSYVLSQIKTGDYKKDIISIVEYYLKLAEQVTKELEGDVKVLCDAYFYDFCIVAEHMSDQIKMRVNEILNIFAKENSTTVDHSKTDAIFDQIETGIKHSFILDSYVWDLILKLKNVKCDEEKRAELALFTALCVRRYIENEADIHYHWSGLFTYKGVEIMDNYEACDKYFDKVTEKLIEQYSEESFAYDAFFSMLFGNTCLMKTLIPERGLDIQEYYNSMGIYPIFSSKRSEMQTVIPFAQPTLLNFKIHEVPISYGGLLNHFYEYVWNVIAALKYKDENLLCSRTMIELLALAISFPSKGLKLLKSKDLTEINGKFSRYVKFISSMIIASYDIFGDAAKYSWAKEIANSELRWVNSSPFHDVLNLLDLVSGFIYKVKKDELPYGAIKNEFSSKDLEIYADDDDGLSYTGFYSYVVTIHRFLMTLRSDIVTCNLLDISLKDYIEYMAKFEKFAYPEKNWIADSSVLRFAVTTKYLYGKKNNIPMLDINYLEWSKAVKDILEELSKGKSDKRYINLAKYIDNYIEIAIAEEESPFMEKGKSIFEEKVMPLVSCWENDSKYYAINEYLTREIELYKLYMSGEVNPIVVDTGFRMIYRDYYSYFENSTNNTVALEQGKLVANSIGVSPKNYKFLTKKEDKKPIFDEENRIAWELKYYTSTPGRQFIKFISKDSYVYLVRDFKSHYILGCGRNLNKCDEPEQISFKPNIRKKYL